ncbi:MAG TPA: hypothetical protein VGM86_32930, partial [Thermoanaerobaculia bacterium]
MIVAFFRRCILLNIRAVVKVIDRELVDNMFAWGAALGLKAEYCGLQRAVAAAPSSRRRIRWIDAEWREERIASLPQAVPRDLRRDFRGVDYISNPSILALLAIAIVGCILVRHFRIIGDWNNVSAHTFLTHAIVWSGL